MRDAVSRTFVGAAAFLVLYVACGSAFAQSAAPPASGFAEVNGTRLHYESRGEGPAVVITGSRDGRNLLNIADTLAAGIPGARKVVIHGSSHHPPVEKPKEFNRALLDFLERR